MNIIMPAGPLSVRFPIHYHVVEIVNNRVPNPSMATVNFSVPEEVKKAFNETFQGRNKSAVVAELMREAIERAHRQQASHDAIGRILERYRRAPVRPDEALRKARQTGRP